MFEEYLIILNIFNATFEKIEGDEVQQRIWIFDECKLMIISDVKYIKMILNRIYRKKIGYAF